MELKKYRLHAKTWQFVDIEATSIEDAFDIASEGIHGHGDLKGKWIQWEDSDFDIYEVEEIKE